MTLDEIKAAVEAGKTVHWYNAGYTVLYNDGDYLIAWNHGGQGANYIGLTRQDGVTMNEKEEEFFIAE